MKTILRISIPLTLLLAVISCAGGPEERSAQTPEAVDTGTVDTGTEDDSAIEPDSAPLIAEEPPEKSTPPVFLTLEDFGDEYTMFSLEDIGADASIFGDELELLTAEIFLNPLDFQLIMDFVFITDDPVSKMGFAMAAASPEMFASSFAEGLGDNAEILKQRTIPDIKEYGNGMTFLILVDGTKFNVELVLLTAESSSAILMIMYFDGSFPPYTMRDVLPLFHRRFM
jgi:hypothetical protein